MERIRRNAPVLLLGAALVAAAVLMLVLTAKTTFYADTWEFLMNRRDPSLDSLLEPHNEHLVAVPVAIEQLLLRVFGMTSSTPEQVVLVALVLALAALLYVYVKRRVGEWPALFAAVLVLFLGPAWEVLLWPFEITFLGPLVCGLGMLLALEREDRLGDALACLLATLGLGFSGLGVPFLLAAAVAVFLGPRETWARRAYVFVVPVALFAIWYVGWGHEAQSHVSLRNVLSSPRYVADTIAVALGALVGLGTNPADGSIEPVWGRILLVALTIGAVAWKLRRPGLHRGLWPVAAAAAANWLLTAFNNSPGREFTASRYQLAGAVFLIMILANLFYGARLGRRGILVGAALTAVAIAPNLVILHDGAKSLEREAVITRSDTAALELARRTVDPSFELDPTVAGTGVLIDVFAAPYFEAVDEYGSLAYSESELETARPEGRYQADVVLSRALPLSTVTRVGVYSGAGGDCVEVVGGGQGAPEVPVTAGTTRIEVAPGAPASLSLRRFADPGSYPVKTADAPGESTVELGIPRDLSSLPWQLHVEAEQLVRVCR
jgi:hypothetical protein